MSYVPGPYDLERGSSCLYCDKRVLARGLCSMHYNRWRRSGEVTRPGPVQGPPVRRWRNRYGSGIVGVRPQPVFEEDDGFWERVRQNQAQRLAERR